MREFRLVYAEDVKEALRQSIELSNADIVIAIGAVNRVPAAATMRTAELGEPYMEECYGEFAMCSSCDAENIVPSRFCRWCGAKLPDFEKYPENY